jgi:BirA family biotin operon repressor/biotin-[acetyl-CoA-carboxylase] ligase
VNAEKIIAAAPSCPFCGALSVVDETASTNDDLLAEARAGAAHGRVIIANHQRGGRGRVGRDWHSPPGLNLYVSALLRPELDDVGKLTPLALVAGLAVAETARSSSKVDARVKWPNDVLIKGRKVAGILMEAAEISGEGPALVIGIGLNVNQTTFPPELADIATSLHIETGRTFDRSSIAARLLEQLHGRISNALGGDVETVLDDWSALSSTIGRRVRPQDGPEGMATAVDLNGALVVRDDEGQIHRVISGLIEEV